MTGLVWVTWRRQRVLLAAAIAVVAGVALFGTLERQVGFDYLAASNTRAVAAFLPAALGVFWGAPLLAGPLENHTADLLWTQTVSRLRWLAYALAGLTVLTVGTALAVRAIVSVVLRTGFSAPYVHDVVSAAAIGYTCFAVALGVFVGAVIGRVEPAMAVTLLVYAVVRYAVGLTRWSGEWWLSASRQWAELAGYGGAAVLLVAATFVVVARRGTAG